MMTKEALIEVKNEGAPARKPWLVRTLWDRRSRRDLNPRHSVPKTDALSAELREQARSGMQDRPTKLPPIQCLEYHLTRQPSSPTFVTFKRCPLI